MSTLWRYHRKALLIAAIPTVVLLALLGVIAVVLHMSTGGKSKGTADSSPAVLTTSTPSIAAVATSSDTSSSSPTAESTTSGSPSPAEPSDMASWNAIPAVTPGFSTDYPAIVGSATKRPYDFAEAFVTELFSQNYRKPRSELLSWAQYESVPIVTDGLPPADEAKGLADSLTDLTWDGEPTAPVPPVGEWLSLQAQSGYLTVSDVKVSADSRWLQAVAAGHKTPDKKMMVVDASLTVTLHTTTGGQPTTSASSVSCKVMLGTATHGHGYGAMYVGTYIVTAA